jgi:hypothetical protein
MTRTFSKADWDAAQEQWRSGDFSPEWRNFRHQAAMRGMIYPPEGSKWDSWEDDEPSQRALLIRAIRETPSLLSEAIGRSKTWGEVINYVLRRRDLWRDELDEKERRARANRPTNREALTSIAAILQRIEDSR